MTVSVQAESDCRMARVFRNCPDRIDGPGDVCSIGKAGVMEAGSRNADLRDDLLEMLQDRVADQTAAFSH